MNHREKLLEIYHQCLENDSCNDLPLEIVNHITQIADNCLTQKGVYTVLITLIVHKILYPQQDIRYHQSQMRGGFSGRTIDTQYITPTLKEIGLPAMAESGWLTRSLEQPHPYTLDYQGKISNRVVKDSFLNLIDFAENNPQFCSTILSNLLKQVCEIVVKNQISIIPIKGKKVLNIKKLISILSNHFSYPYHVRGGSKLPVLAFYAIYQELIKEVDRYKTCTLKPLGSHTSSDRTSNSSGDIEVLNQNQQVFETLEIKLGKVIDLQMLRIAKEKISQFHPQRYCIFSTAEIKTSEIEQINQEIDIISRSTNCQIIINGVLPTLEYYLRLINSIENFINSYSSLLEKDREVKLIHKEKWNELLHLFLNH